MLARIAVALAAVVLLAGCGAFEPADCRKADLAAYADQMEQQIQTFRQQSDLVATAPRMTMGVPLQRLLDIQTATRAIAAPGCVADYHERTVRTMEIHQIAYQGFASQQIDASIVALTLAEGKRLLDEAEANLGVIRAGTVPPTPTPIPATPTPAPTATAEVLAEPQRASIPAVVSSALTPGPVRGGYTFCFGDQVDLLARQRIDGLDWVKVRLVKRASGCPSQTDVGEESWLLASEVK